MRTHDTEHVETVIIGAGQAGLATGYHLQRAGRPFVILDGEAGSATGGGTSGTPCACSPRPGRTACPGCPTPDRAGRSRPRTSSPTTWSRMPPPSHLPVRLATRVDRRSRAAATGSPSTTAGHAHRVPTTSSSAPAPSVGHRTCPASPTSSTRRSGSCTRASTGEPPSWPTGRCSSSAPRTPAATSPTRSPRRTRRCCAGRTPGRSRSRSPRRCSRWSSRPCSSCSGTS